MGQEFWNLILRSVRERQGGCIWPGYSGATSLHGQEARCISMPSSDHSVGSWFPSIPPPWKRLVKQNYVCKTAPPKGCWFPEAAKCLLPKTITSMWVCKDKSHFQDGRSQGKTARFTFLYTVPHEQASLVKEKSGVLEIEVKYWWGIGAVPQLTCYSFIFLRTHHLISSSQYPCKICSVLFCIWGTLRKIVWPKW